MQRRNDAITGWVNFPVNDSTWINSMEGGMVVKLVVCDDQEWEQQWGVCCGTNVYDILSESLINDDIRPQPSNLDSKYESYEQIKLEQMAIQKWESYHFPNLHNDNENDILKKYCSRPYKAVIVLGSTGWSGYNPKKGYWYCTYEDLTEKGKQLYNIIQDLYPGCTLHLLTFLDT